MFLHYYLECRKRRKSLGFLPDNAYVGNSAGDYVFISIIKDTEIYTLTDCYNLDAEMKDKGV